MSTQIEKANTFKHLHAGASILIMPNPWDAGSARLLASMGFSALATSSYAAAAVLGRHDYQLSRHEALAHARAIATATDLPVAADLENGFGAAPELVAETIRLAAETGIVGGSIEDTTGETDKPLFEFNHAVERVAAAVEAAHALDFPFTLTARTENYFWGNPDLDDTIKRLQAFERVGADVLFAPGLPSLVAVQAVCAAVSKPVNFMVGIPGKSFSVTELELAGVKRISLSGALYGAAMKGLRAAAREVQEHGTFHFLDHA